MSVSDYVKTNVMKKERHPQFEVVLHHRAVLKTRATKQKGKSEDKNWLKDTSKTKQKRNWLREKKQKKKKKKKRDGHTP